MLRRYVRRSLLPFPGKIQKQLKDIDEVQVEREGTKNG
jgi:hypothetical protein